MDLLQTYVKKHKMYVQSMRPAWPLVKRHDPFSLHFSDTALRQCGRLHPSVSGIAVPNLPSLLHFLPLVRGSAIGSTPAFGAGYPGSSPGPGANFSCCQDDEDSRPRAWRHLVHRLSIFDDVPRSVACARRKNRRRPHSLRGRPGDLEPHSPHSPLAVRNGCGADHFVSPGWLDDRVGECAV